MKKLILLTLVCFSCSRELIVRTDFDKSFEIHRNSTYSWLDNKNIEIRNNPLYYNELNDKRIKDAVNLELSNKGYTLTDNAAELIVHYHIVVENRTAIQTDPYGYNYGIYWTRGQTDVYRYREGTLAIDFMDARNRNLIWRGSATSIIDDDDQITEETINKAVAKIFMSFPVSVKKEIVTQ
ncbi:MAG TPA: DUF4136 domain-containing protein [Cyclobacteriaceae bacterium]|nr:DUF4136 domain-containing protein [Cyclobacteriaceae bacterium]